ncbi:MAG: hypothetical protein WCH40_12855 [Verrucomicrobiales bacterium]
MFAEQIDLPSNCRDGVGFRASDVEPSSLQRSLQHTAGSQFQLEFQGRSQGAASALTNSRGTGTARPLAIHGGLQQGKKELKAQTGGLAEIVKIEFDPDCLLANPWNYVARNLMAHSERLLGS